MREPGGAYLHLTREGVPAYDARWRHAGDFRDGIAVVQADDGRSTHIDPDRVPIHGAWFLDLDLNVFHKGFARAGDEDGWMPVDTAGHPQYRGRFSAVEPFDNGEARAERLDGGLAVIDETGTAVVELRPALKSEFAAPSDDLTVFWRTQAICAAVELAVFEALPGAAVGLARARGQAPDRARHRRATTINTRNELAILASKRNPLPAVAARNLIQIDARVSSRLSRYNRVRADVVEIVCIRHRNMDVGRHI